MLGVAFGTEWNPIDRALAQAFVLVEDSTCGGCGQPLLRSTDEDAIGHLEIHEVWCEGCVQMGRDADVHEHPPAGRKPYVVDTANH